MAARCPDDVRQGAESVSTGSTNHGDAGRRPRPTRPGRELGSSQVAEIGLEALDDLQKNRPVSADTRQRNIEFLQLAAKPQAVLLLMVAPSVELLVQVTRIQ